MKRKIRGKSVKEKIGGREEQASEEGQREGGKEGEELSREGEIRIRRRKEKRESVRKQGSGYGRKGA